MQDPWVQVTQTSLRTSFDHVVGAPWKRGHVVAEYHVNYATHPRFDPAIVRDRQSRDG